MIKNSYKRTKYACYFTYLAASSIFSLPPLLFATFRQMYGISYTMLGALVLTNFCTQMIVDLIFTFFSKYFNIHKTIRIMPLLTALGLIIYALIPMLFPQFAYVGLLVGTVIFSISAGLGEVLLSPTVAALPSDTPDKDMSALHSLYGYGFVGVTLISTVFLFFVGSKYWMYLTFFWALLPVIACVLLTTSPLPNLNIGDKEVKSCRTWHRTKSILLCLVCIFVGSCAENTMSNWISVYTEKVLSMPKIWGDIFGMSLFAALLALTRTVYAKYGKNILKTLFWSMVGAGIFYAVAALSINNIVSLAACVLIGICTSMLWPGTLILMEEKVPFPSVAAYALMAAGGDFGASFAPQTLGIIVDKISTTKWAEDFGKTLLLSSEQVGFRAGMLIATVFCIFGVILLLYMKKHLKG